VILSGADGHDIRVPAPMVIAADGRRSRIAMPLGLARHPPQPRRWAVGAYFEGVEDVGSFGEMHVRRGRYFGVAPLPSGLTNVCVVVPRIAALADPRRLLLDTVAGDPAVRDRFRSARLATAPVVVGPLAVDARKPGIPGVLLAGDAAGFIDPMTGDGLRFAVRGGELAAAAALATLGGRAARPHEILARSRRREFAAKWRFNRALRRLVGGDATVTLAAIAANAAPWTLRRAIAFAADVPR
jgi:flavin-dependent dehydrogenase